ncbi:dTDP-4-dehydrorhamnose 3,5-epimerase [Sulfitobacter sabulilitoris]|uniref:dTDP-4-dehydrorhamnose 3,5-epimerase n=1 Tax=Sulfitobacter sabulilitoris TaxID=2562655 RepID=A0A5S3P848_9RHOB|nr:dTDP-4-dehydrorhamnose 3,5-epimerase [Sulfitobacter sabulilitoris]TMM49542.1 dTDP-4-dehydrorhamnose 3,5-epimerase [Sulfitobacter sabulilitoris]
MKFMETGIDGLFVTEQEPFTDERGAFARTFCAREFAEHGLETQFVQHSRSMSKRKGTLRGLHFQRPPDGEVKLVSCVSGAIWDVAVDLRSGSQSYGHWRAFELSAENGRQFYIPAGFAHGFQSLTDHAVTHYLISCAYAPGSANGIRFDDSDIGITWPRPVTAISEKDLSWPRLCDSDPADAAQSAQPVF